MIARSRPAGKRIHMPMIGRVHRVLLSPGGDLVPDADLRVRYEAAMRRLREAQHEVRLLEEEMGLAGEGGLVGRDQPSDPRLTLQNPTDKAAEETYRAEHELHLIYQPPGTPNTITTSQWVERITGNKHTSKSLVTGWRTLGHALLAVGLDPGGLTYIRLRNSNAYAIGEVKQAVFAKGATEDSICEVLDKYADKEGKRLPGRRG